ncbi:hypothetical protein RvY_01453 [Ramazzottius varieornatus]|uniref:CBF1-interacting co-repressor CIR N-terminal domain-containing protein n=1 Tax=Ramazzottius varieornatus TaxID=947166 RepID=A0A1D1UGQ6_RAMVA|nr:hypothetical protein RvY_01453 [Ramazzottius varieornatus]
MNILPKKKWHVRTKDNIARVRRDEAQAAEEENERLRKIALAEQEARTNALRAQARSRTADASASLERVDELTELFGPVEEKPLEHVNIFKDAEEGKSTALINEEHEKEKKAEQEKYEKSIGYLTYLGQSASDAQHVKPWYTLKHEERTQLPTSSGLILQKPVKNSDEKLKNFYDPLKSIKSYVEKTKQHGSAGALTSSVKLAITHGESEISRKRKREDFTVDDELLTPRPKTIEELRAERLRREAAEKVRTKDLLAGRSAGVPKPNPRPPDNPRTQKYNSQFNPWLARQNVNDLDKRNNY